MDFLRRLFGGGNAAPADNALHMYVRCGRCGAPVHVRVHMYNDLAVEYNDDDVAGYTLHKEIMDSTCFRLIQADISFDRNRREQGRTINGGEFISREEYDRLAASQQGRP
jgi:hypothetical protein